MYYMMGEECGQKKKKKWKKALFSIQEEQFYCLFYVLISNIIGRKESTTKQKALFQNYLSGLSASYETLIPLLLFPFVFS